MKKREGQHFVSRFILDNFSIQNRAGFIFAYQRNNKPIDVSTLNIAKQTNFYNFKNKFTKKYDDYIEKKIFAELLESKTKPLIEKIKNAAKIDLNDFEESVLASFVAYAFTRTPAFRAQIKHFILSFSFHNIKNEFNKNKNYFKEILESENIKINDDEIQQTKDFFTKNNQDFSGIDIEGAENHLIYASLIVAEKIAPIIFHKNLHILEATNDFFFITSDNPVTILDFKNSPKWPTEWNFEQEDISIVFPFSPTRCLIYDKKGRGKEIIKVNLKEMTDYVNFNTMFYADKFVFCNIKSKSIQNFFNNTKKQYHFK